MTGREADLVEVKLDGKWGGVCDDGFSFNEANVVCRQLGFELGAEQVINGQGKNPTDLPGNIYHGQLGTILFLNMLLCFLLNKHWPNVSFIRAIFFLISMSFFISKYGYIYSRLLRLNIIF